MSVETSVPRGKFIVFEGGDGSGKSTQVERLASRLGAVRTREPGGTPVGDKIRALVLDPSHTELGYRAEALLMAAARAQHVDELIEPALTQGSHVVCDRYVASSLAYQGAGRGVGMDAVADINAVATNGVMPDLTVLLDVNAETSRARLPDSLDRIEEAGADLAKQVVQTYRTLAAAHPESWVVIDANDTIDEVTERVDAAIAERLGL